LSKKEVKSFKGKNTNKVRRKPHVEKKGGGRAKAMLPYRQRLYVGKGKRLESQRGGEDQWVMGSNNDGIKASSFNAERGGIVKFLEKDNTMIEGKLAIRAYVAGVQVKEVSKT